MGGLKKLGGGEKNGGGCLNFFCRALKKDSVVMGGLVVVVESDFSVDLWHWLS